MIDPIIEKIKKLLRMKRGGTPGEIENALAMAAELARKHGIDLNSVNPDDESKSETITHFEEVLKLRLPLEAKFAAAILVNFFNVQICHMQGGTHREGYIKYKFNHSMIFVGTDWDIQVAQNPGGIESACIVKSMTPLTAEEAAAIPKKFKP